jgi:hypothetical protein
MIITKLEAIQSLDPTLGFSLDVDGTLTLAEMDGIENTGVLPTEAEVATEMSRLQDEYDNAQYARDRATAYPPMADQLDDIFHNGVDGWKATIQAVKDANPKPV